MTEEEFRSLKVGDLVVRGGPDVVYAYTAQVVRPSMVPDYLWEAKIVIHRHEHRLGELINLKNPICWDLCAPPAAAARTPSKEISHWNTTCSGCGGRGNMGFLFFDCEAKCARPGDVNAR